MRNSEVLQKKFDQVVRTGEVPYQANRRALRTLDIENDGEGGLREVDLTLSGLGILIRDLADLRKTATQLQTGSVAQSRKAALPPAFFKLKTVLSFKELALRFATIRAAIKELKATEDVMVKSPTTQNLRDGLKEFAYFAGVIVEETTKAIVVARAIQKKVLVYKRELANAIG